MSEQRGSITVVMAAFVVVTAVLAVGIVRLGATAAGRARAQATADAAALAGAGHGEEAARAIAADNDAVLIGYREEGDDVVVTVRRGEHEVRARARREIVGAGDSVPRIVGGTGSRTLRPRGHEAIR